MTAASEPQKTVDIGATSQQNSKKQRNQPNTGDRMRSAVPKRGQVKAAASTLGVMTNFGILSLIALASISNIIAFHAFLGAALDWRFNPVFSLGGLLEHYLFNAAFRLFAIGFLCWFLLLSNRKKNWLDWVGVGLLTIAGLTGTGGLLENSDWVLAILFWYVFQSFQFGGLFDEDKGFMTLAAIGSYGFEFMIQCTANPITPLSFTKFLEAIHLGTIQSSDIFPGMIVLNILCMMGVEWGWRFYLALNKISVNEYTR